MFYQQQLIHTPDSPRNQAPIPWTFNKTLRTGHKHIDVIQNQINIDYRNIEEQIAQGFVYLHTTNRRVQFIYKIPSGVYTIHGFRKGSIDIPLPELYVAGHLDIYEDFISENNIRIGSRYLPLLPFSNIHNDDGCESFEINKSNDKPIHYMRMCTGGVLKNLIRDIKNPLDAANKLQAVIIPFFLSYGNYDLSLCNFYSHSLNGITARQITRILDNRLDINSDHYARYWVLLNYLNQQYDTDYIYETLASMTDSDQVFETFNITPNEIAEYYKQYQSSANKILN